MRQEKHAEAAETMVRFGGSGDATGAANAQRKAYLSAVVALLFDGDGVGAQATYTDVGDVPAFAQRGAARGVPAARRVPGKAARGRTSSASARRRRS